MGPTRRTTKRGSGRTGWLTRPARGWRAMSAMAGAEMGGYGSTREYICVSPLYHTVLSQRSHRCMPPQQRSSQSPTRHCPFINSPNRIITTLPRCSYIKRREEKGGRRVAHVWPINRCWKAPSLWIWPSIPPELCPHSSAFADSFSFLSLLCHRQHAVEHGLRLRRKLRVSLDFMEYIDGTLVVKVLGR